MEKKTIWQCHNPACNEQYGEYVNGCPKCCTGEPGGSHKVSILNEFHPAYQQGAVWVKASERLPDSWHLKCVRFIHTKQPLIDPETWIDDNPNAIEVVEWLDERGQFPKP